MTFAQTFKKYRKNVGYTQEEIADKLLVTPQAVSKWETGVGTPDISLLVPIADLFGITTDALLGNAKKTREELSEEIKSIKASWNGDAENNYNFGERYSKLYCLLKSNPDSIELLRSLLNLSLEWLSACSGELNDNKKREIVSNAEKIAERLRDDPEDIHSSHCLMYEIYFRAGETQKAEAELMNFSASGQYTRDRVKYIHLMMDENYKEALPYLESSLQHTIHWLRWDIRRLEFIEEYLNDEVIKSRFDKINNEIKSEIKQLQAID